MNLGLEADRAAVDFCESVARQPATYPSAASALIPPH